MRKLILFALVFFLCCNGNGPPPPPPPPTCAVWSVPEGCDCPLQSPFVPLLGVCAPPRADRHVDFGATRGVTAFSLAMRSTREIADFTHHIHAYGWNTLRVGAQTTHDWCSARALTLANSLEYDELEFLANQDLLFHMASNSYLPCGPFHGTPEWEENLVRMLDVTARIKDNWVQLIPTFTYKSHDEGTQKKNIEFFNKMFDRVHAIVKRGDYKHVFYEVFNEVEHPLSQHIKDEDVREMFLHIKDVTDIRVGTDFDGLGSGPEWRGRYPYQWRDVSDYIAFHTPRNPEPRYAIMREAQDKFKYSKPVLVDETVCWASEDAIRTYSLKGRGTIAKLGYSTEDKRMQQVVDHLRDIHRLGWHPTYHSIWGIHCEHYGRIPTYSKDIAQ